MMIIIMINSIKRRRIRLMYIQLKTIIGAISISNIKVNRSNKIKSWRWTIKLLVMVKNNEYIIYIELLIKKWSWWGSNPWLSAY